MAKTTESKTKKREVQRVPPDLAGLWKALYQRGIVGVLVLSLAIVTFIGLLQENSGFLIDWWSALLLSVFGWGSFVVTMIAAALGALILADKVPDRSKVPWHIIVGAEVIFFALLSLSHVFLAPGEPWRIAQRGGGGGYVGAVFGGVLAEFLGPGIAGVILGVVLLWGAIIASGQSFEDWAERIEAWIYARLGRDVTDMRDESPTVYLEVEHQEQTQAAAPSPSQPRHARKFKITLPPIKLLDEPLETQTDEADIQHKKRVIEVTLAQFGVPAEVTEINRGPMVTQFGVEPGYVTLIDQNGQEKLRKIRVSKIASLSNDLALALAAAPIRIEAPIPGRSLVGVEVPNSQTAPVSLRKVLRSPGFQRRKSDLMLALGEGVAGMPILADLAKMPHLLLAGTTGSGKSVCINALATCLLFQNSPLTLRLVMIDPKRVEMVHYSTLPHLLGQVESDVERIVGVLHWLVNEMQVRYQRFSQVGARHLEDYNRHWQTGSSEHVPRIVTMIDELADLMLFAPEEVEKSICRLAQMARATGIHLIMATQRPSVDVVTGLIKANFPARIGFTVSSGTDSRVILDGVGAETLLGRGDMLFMSPESSEMVRVQGSFVSDDEIDRVVRYWQDWAQREEWETETAPWDRLITREEALQGDDLLQQAIEIVREQGAASASMLQRRMHIGYPRAARLIDDLERLGVVGPAETGGRSRKVLDLSGFGGEPSAGQGIGV